MNRIKKQCALCKNEFIPKTVTSIYCTESCSKKAYKQKKAQHKKEERLKALANKIPADRLLISVPEATILFGIAKTTIYRLIRQQKIPVTNLGTRLLRIDRKVMEEIFPITSITPQQESKPPKKLYSLEKEDCYSIGEITKKFNISDSSVHKHIRKYSIPTRQIGNYVYAPKIEIDNLYNGK